PAQPAPAPVEAPPAQAPAPKAPPQAVGSDVRPLRGGAARLVANMEASLAVPTATSARAVPARLLEVNRKVLNGYMSRTGGVKVSFTHLIGYAVVRALEAVPAMRSVYVAGDNGQAGVSRQPVIGLGLAIDVAKSDGTRTLLVPCIRDVGSLDFAAFHAAYEDVVRRVRNNKITPEDFAGVTMTLTNPGTLGTVSSVPRLMPGQSVIVGVGALGWPAEYAGADPQVMAQLGISKVLTLTSTYDHRVIQGAESGLYLQRVEQLLLGADGFYDGIFRSLGVPYESVRWRRDTNPLDGMGNGAVQREKQVHVQTLTNMYRVRGHLIADLDPLSWKEPRTHPELDP
ncbi:MAG: 2-oxo acid dehydrogenase subunit E2, partial [Acidimicrobiales bacterium]|nr:2-oxo acid dehydrogenase subunit E2 [Acidimicrobiales bacterium]